jgi:hypothetical protein
LDVVHGSAGSGSAGSGSAGSDSAASLAAISQLREKDISETNGLAEVTEQIQEEVQNENFSKKKTIHIAKMYVRARGVCAPPTPSSDRSPVPPTLADIAKRRMATSPKRWSFSPR